MSTLEISDRVYRIPNMDCASEESEIRELLAAADGLHGLRFRLSARELQVRAAHGAWSGIEARLRAGGFAPQPVPAENASPSGLVARAWAGLRVAPGPRRIGVALALALVAELVHALYPQQALLGTALALVAILLSGLSTYWKGLQALRRWRLSVSALMAAAVSGAFALGQWPEAAMVMALYALAEHLEARAFDRARGAISGLLQMAPARVERRDEATGRWHEVAAADVAVGAVVRAKPGARLALDGIVTAGCSAVDEAPVTGESLPVDKRPGDPVYAGTLNRTGLLQLRVTARAQDTQLARIIHAVEQAQASRAPSQAFIDRFAAWYTPAVFAAALGVALLAPALAGWTWHTAIYRALVLLVIACPCALVIATPVTIVSALAQAARRGLIIKGGAHLERARQVRAVAFDKTGTLTEGRPVLVACQALVPDVPERVWQRWAATLADRSEHPVSRAIAQGLAAHGVAPGPCHGFIERPGEGVAADIGAHHLQLISERSAREQGLVDAALAQRLAAQQAAGSSASLLVANGRAVAVLAVADTEKSHAAQALARLHAMGIQTVMLSGDRQHAAQALGRRLGVGDVRAELLPQDKLTCIAALRAQHGVVAMVGDGINDGPALAGSDLGIAMGGAGTDLALEAADVVVMNDDLRQLPELVDLSRRTNAVLWQNIGLALGIKLAILALAILGSATMWMAVFADMGASLIVIANGLRMLRASGTVGD